MLFTVLVQQLKIEQSLLDIVVLLGCQTKYFAIIPAMFILAVLVQEINKHQQHVS